MVLKKKKFQLSLLYSISFILLLLLTGCWDRIEVNDLAIITAMGVEKKEDDLIELTVLVFVPKESTGKQEMEGGTSGSPSVLFRSAEGVTIADAMSKLQQKFPRRLFWGHAEVLIIGEKFAQEDIRPHLDFILRHPQLRERANVFVSKQNMEEIFQLSPPIERNLAEVLYELSKLKIGMDVTVKTLGQMFVGDSKAAAIPYIEILPPKKGQPKNQTITYITGTAIFKEGKMIGLIDEKMTRGVLWFRNEIVDAVVTIKPDNEKGYVSMSLLRARSVLIPKIEDNRWHITLKAVTEDDIIQNGTRLNMHRRENIEMLEKKLVEEIEGRIQSAIETVQKEMKADIFGFAEAFERSYPEIWEKNKDNWEEIFPNVTVTIDAKAYVRRPGMNIKPALFPEEEVKN